MTTARRPDNNREKIELYVPVFANSNWVVLISRRSNERPCSPSN